jgi:flagellar motor protein MotB
MAGLAGIFFVLMAGAIALLGAENRTLKTEKNTAVENQQKAKDSAKALLERDDHYRTLVRSHLRSILHDFDRPDAGSGLGQRADAGGAADPDLIEIRFDTDGSLTTFESGKYELRDCDQKTRAAERISYVLKRLCQLRLDASGRRIIDRIVLEGHTDNQSARESASPIASCNGLAKQDDYKSSFGANVELSSRRAVHLLRVALESTMADDEVRKCIEEKFLVSGRGPLEPVCGDGPCVTGDWRSPQSLSAQKASRRVVFRVYGRRDYSSMAEEERDGGGP